MSAKFHKSWSTFQFWDQILHVCNFGSRSSIPINILIISKFNLLWVPDFIKIGHIANLRPNLPKFLISGQDPQFQISYLCLTNLTCFDCHEGIDTCFNVKCVLLGRNFDFLGGYCSLPSGYCSLLGGYWWLLLVTARYCSFPLLVWTCLQLITILTLF